jgi:hypothetical protein
VQRQQLERLGRRGGAQDLVAVAAEQPVQRGQHIHIVIDDQQGLRRLAGRARRRRQAAAERTSAQLLGGSGRLKK